MIECLFFFSFCFAKRKEETQNEAAVFHFQLKNILVPYQIFGDYVTLKKKKKENNNFFFHFRSGPFF